MSFKDALLWLRGKRVALCEPDPEKFQALKKLLNQYGLVVSDFNTVDEILFELDRQQYSTLQVFVVMLVDYQLAREVEHVWQKVTSENPTILQTPVVLLRTPMQIPLAQDMVDKGYFKYQLDSPVKAKALLKVLDSLNRWKALQSEVKVQDVKPAAILNKDK